MSQNKSVEEVVEAWPEEEKRDNYVAGSLETSYTLDGIFDVSSLVENLRQTSQEREREIVRRLSRYAEHSHRCFLFTADTDEYDHAKCDCGLTEIFTNPNKD